MPDEPACRFELPIPPSVNNLFVNRAGKLHGGRAKGSDYKRWLHDAGWTIKIGLPHHVPGIVRVLIEAPLNRRRDLDNVLKPLLDLLVKMAVIVDDSLIDDLRIVRVGTGDKCVVSIWPLANGAVTDVG